MWWRNCGLEYSGKLSLDVVQRIREETLGVQNTSILGIILRYPARPFWNHLSPTQCHTRNKKCSYLPIIIFLSFPPLIEVGVCFGFLWLLSHITYLLASINLTLLAFCSWGQKIEMGLPGLKPKDQQGIHLFWRLRGEICFQPFPASRVCLPPWVYRPFHPQGQQWMGDFFSHLSHSSAFLLFIYKDPGVSTGPLWIIQDPLPILTETFIPSLPWKVT